MNYFSIFTDLFGANTTCSEIESNYFGSFKSLEEAVKAIQIDRSYTDTCEVDIPVNELLMLYFEDWKGQPPYLYYKLDGKYHIYRNS